MQQNRVYEIARDYGITSQEIMLELTTLGVWVRSASSPVPPPALRALESRLQSQGKEFTEYQAPEPTLLTTNEAAKLAGVSPATIRQWVQRGKLEPAGTQGRSLVFDATSIPTASTGRGTAKVIHIESQLSWKDRENPHLFTVDELIPRISTLETALSKSTIRTWAARGLIPVRGKRGRSNLYSLQDIEKLMSSRSRKAR